MNKFISPLTHCHWDLIAFRDIVILLPSDKILCMCKSIHFNLSYILYDYLSDDLSAFTNLQLKSIFLSIGKRKRHVDSIYIHTMNRTH